MLPLGSQITQWANIPANVAYVGDESLSVSFLKSIKFSPPARYATHETGGLTLGDLRTVHIVVAPATVAAIGFHTIPSQPIVCLGLKES